MTNGMSIFLATFPQIFCEVFIQFGQVKNHASLRLAGFYRHATEHNIILQNVQKSCLTSNGYKMNTFTVTVRLTQAWA